MHHIERPPGPNENPAPLAGGNRAEFFGNLDRKEHSAAIIGDQGPALRPYQADVIARAWQAIVAGHRRILLVAPTGAGKTVIAGALTQERVAAGARALFLAHRRELVTQASAKLYSVGVDHGIVQAGMPTRPLARVQVASISTLHARAVRSEAMPLPPADLVLVDEAHHARSRSWQAILDAYPEAVIIGLTATPCRGDGRGLGNLFDCIIECPGIAELTTMGHLVPARIYAPAEPDLKGIKTARGDYIEADLAKRMNRPDLVGGIVEHWLRLASGRPTVVFATGVAHSVAVRDDFRGAGVMAEHLDGTTPADERDAILRGLSAGKVDIVCNAMVLIEGWDCPAASCAVLARPTRQLGLYLQCVGRVLRPAPGKANALILDHAGAVFQHGFPDDRIAWTLHADRRAENLSQRSRSDGRAGSVSTCPECKAVRLAGEPCPACGWRPRVRPLHVDVADGELAAVDRNRQARAAEPIREERINFHRQLLGIAQEKGYQKGWASHKYREKFGAWPDLRDPTPLPPEPATRAWVKSRAIAWAKAQERARGAA